MFEIFSGSFSWKEVVDFVFYGLFGVLPSRLGVRVETFLLFYSDLGVFRVDLGT